MMIAKVSRQLVFGVILLGSFALGTTAHTAGTPAQQCQAGKAKTAGKYAACRANAEAKLVVTGDIPKYTDALDKCATKFAAAWQKLEDKATAASAVCPADETVVKDKTDAYTDSVAALGAGTRFTDNGDGTVTDHQTGLMWEQKDTAVGSGTNYADPHDVDNTYSWNTTLDGTTPNGTAFTDFLDKLNNCLSGDGSTVTGGFAGHCGWRLPTLVELQTIVDLGATACTLGAPCIDPIFGPTWTNYYWSATTGPGPQSAWGVFFNDGFLFSELKDNSGYVRAVRGGL